MQNQKSRVFLALSVAIFCVAFFVGAAHAQEPPSVAGGVITVATVNIYDPIIVSQDNNAIKLSFELANREQVQPDVRYAVQLIKPDVRGGSIADEMVYPEKITLAENETMKKEINYTAPDYLKGAFQVWIIAKNANGMLLALAEAGEVTLDGSGQYVEIDSNSCYLTVAGEAGGKRYDLTQGVDIDSEEKIIAACDFINRLSADIAITPQFKTYWRSTFGQLVKDNQEPQPTQTLTAGQKKNLSFTLPKALEPQAYDAVLELADGQGKVISNRAVFHYVLRGTSATIQNLRLDKDYYQAGETAKASFFWTGSADNFPGSRLGGSGSQKIVISLNVQSSEGKSCVQTMQKEMAPTEANIIYDLPIINDCPDPKISVSLQDENGKILDQKEYALTSQDVPVEPPVKKQPTAGISGEKQRDRLTLYGLIFIVALVVISLAIIFVKKGHLPILILLVIIAGGAVLPRHEVKADTFSVGYSYIYTTFTVNLNKQQYKPGENVKASSSGNIYNLLCINGHTDASLEVLINNILKTLFSGKLWLNNSAMYGSANIPAEKLPGNYKALFRARAHDKYAEYSIPYTVVNNVPNPPTVETTVENCMGEPFIFTVTSTDPDGDPIRYGFDWDMNGVVDQWIPKPTPPTKKYVSSGTAMTVTHSWTAVGIGKKFQVLAQDSYGSNSLWTNHSVDIKECCIPKNSCDVSKINPNDWFGCNAPCQGTGTEYALCDDNCGGKIVEIRPCANNDPCPVRWKEIPAQ